MKVEFSEKGLLFLLTLASCTTLLIMGIDTIVGFSLLTVVCGYFGIEVFPWPQIRKRKEKK